MIAFGAIVAGLILALMLSLILSASRKPVTPQDLAPLSSGLVELYFHARHPADHREGNYE